MRHLVLVISSSAFLLCPAFAGESIYISADNIEGLAETHNHWQQACKSVDALQVPPIRQPQHANYHTATGCDAQDMYDDEKNAENSTPADWREVHSCAVAEDDTSTLMMLYANGLGVQRNLPLAIKYACATNGAVAEVQGWVDYLSVQDENGDLRNFDVCDYATSGYLVGLCAARHERQIAKLRDLRIEIFKKKLTKIELLEFNKLNDAANTFCNNRGRLETDLSGSARVAFEIEATSAQQSSFIELLDILESDKGNALPRIDLRQVNRQLHDQYRKILDNLDPSGNESEYETNWLSYTTITKPNVKQTQLSWLQYRDSWIRFAKIRYPTLDQTTLAAYLTSQRLAQLRELAS